MAETLSIPITKAGANIEIGTDQFPDNVYLEALRLGFKEILNRGMSKITVAKLEGEDLAKARAAAMEKAEKNLTDAKAGKVRIVGIKASKGASNSVILTEARRLARNLVKQSMKSQGIKISSVAASDITAAANSLLALEEGKALLEQAKDNIAKRDAESATIQAKLAEIVTPAMVDPKLVAKNAAKAAAEKDGTLSAKQAGKTKPKQKPQANA